MASLTPGTLQKLLHNAGDKHFRVAGEHRSALLQVISIVPSIEDDPWKSRGYYLRVSDSVHSAYVSVSNEDVELILSDKVQLGQFIHVTWLDAGSPVPVLRGLKPIPNRRPCVGDPTDLISCDFLNAKKVVKPKEKVRKVVANEEGNLRRISFGSVGRGVESRRLSLDSARKGWESSPHTKNGASKSKMNDNSSRSDSISSQVVTNKAIPEASPKSSTFSPLKSKNNITSPKPPMKPEKTLKLPDDDIFPIDFNKVAINSRRVSNLKISWDVFPSNMRDLGKEVGSCRNAAIGSAASALEEASVFDGLIRCMSKFAELCELSQKDNCGPLVEQFLNIHESIKKASMVVNALINSRTSDTKNGNDCSSRKNASLWVQAAVQTDLSKFSLYVKGGDNGIKNGKNCHYVVIENTQEKINSENHCSHKIKKNLMSSNKSASKATSQSRHRVRGTNGGDEPWLKGLGSKHAADLAEKLLSSSCAWFLDYLENSLDNGFGLRRDGSSQITFLLGQLKRVNQWLNDVFKGDEVDERIERLRKKLYRFLLDHVDSAVSQM